MNLRNIILISYNCNMVVLDILCNNTIFFFVCQKCQTYTSNYCNEKDSADHQCLPLSIFVYELGCGILKSPDNDQHHKSEQSHEAICTDSNIQEHIVPI